LNAKVDGPDLAAIVDTWAAVPEASKAGILAMVETALPKP
jgi:hypothetical protein